MEILNEVNLKPYNTFGLVAKARYFSKAQQVEDFQEVVKTELYLRNPSLILGGGSNVLLTRDFDGIVIRNEIKGIEVVKESQEYVCVKAMAGEVWHNFVTWCVDHNYAGLENLSLIPGSVGAAPMQNIGAYGVEIKDTFWELEALEIASGKVVVFTNSQCEFGYRESVFKRQFKNQFIILSVTFRLSKTPVLNTSYGAIEQELQKMGITALTIQAVSQAVINIRKSKLPDPAVLGNSGSFFKNPLVSEELYNQIKTNYPDVVAYPAGTNYKLAAGWLIEKAGFKGIRRGDAGVHTLQALVLVNHGGATGKEIYDLSTEIVNTIKDRFGVELEREVNII